VDSDRERADGKFQKLGKNGFGKGKEKTYEYNKPDLHGSRSRDE
jgi:hypothetical protein